MYDICIIGAGVTGCAVARELSRYEANICVIEKCEDVCCGTSKANSAIVHAGFDAPNGSLMAKLNVQGNERMEELAKELDFPFRRNGSLVVCLHEEDLPKLQGLYDKGVKNGGKRAAHLIQTRGTGNRTKPGGRCGWRAVRADWRNCMPVFNDDRACGKCQYKRRRISI